MAQQHLDAATQVQGLVHESSESVLDCPGYEILRELGRGGMGCVYLAKQTTLDRLVALKTIRSADASLAAILLQEAKIVGQLEHPAIVPVIEVNVESQPWFFSMAYVGEEDLARRIIRRVLEPKEVVELGITLCDAIHYAHSQGVLHLDIKPANILLDRKGNPKLTDFGLAAVHQSNRQGVFGTPQFMSPEQVVGAEELKPTTDVYSLGAVLYSALTGSPPIAAANQEDLAMRVVSHRPRNFKDFGLSVPVELAAIIMQCLEKQPQRRYASADALKADLVAYQAGEPIKARPPSLYSRVVFFLRHHILAASVSSSVVILLLLLVGWVVANFFTQSMELQELQDRYSTLRGRLSLLDRQTRFEIEAAVAQEHFDQGKILLAGKPAAEAVIAAADGNEAPNEMLVEILREYAKLTEFDYEPDWDPRTLAQALLDGMEPESSASSEPEVPLEDPDLIESRLMEK